MHTENKPRIGPQAETQPLTGREEATRPSFRVVLASPRQQALGRVKGVPS